MISLKGKIISEILPTAKITSIEMSKLSLVMVSIYSK